MKIEIQYTKNTWATAKVVLRCLPPQTPTLTEMFQISITSQCGSGTRGAGTSQGEVAQLMPHVQAPESMLETQ